MVDGCSAGRTDQNRYGFHATGIWVSSVFIMDAPKTMGDEAAAVDEEVEHPQNSCRPLRLPKKAKKKRRRSIKKYTASISPVRRRRGEQTSAKSPNCAIENK